MRKAANPVVAALLGLLFVLAGCSEVGITGRKQLNFVPDSLINSLSIEQYSQFINQSKVITGTPQAEMVKRVGARIEAAVNAYSKEHSESDPFAGYQWEFNLVEDPNVNAFAMPGGKVVVYTGILPIAQNDAGLATVMGHEIAHVYAKHGAERMSQSLIVQMGGVGLSTALKNQPETTKSLFNTAYSLGSQVGVLLPYSRLQESEADRLGMIFMAMAGYDPHEAVGFWQRMAVAAGGQAPPEFLSTHPANETRIKNLQELVPEAMEYYKPTGTAGQGQTSTAPAPGTTSQALTFPPVKK
jgi:predicted Zn-dependent protease